MDEISGCSKRDFCLKLIEAGSREIRGMSGWRTKVATTCGRVLLPLEELFLADTFPFPCSLCSHHLFSLNNQNQTPVRERKQIRPDSFPKESTHCCSFGKAQVVRCLLGQASPPLGLISQSKTKHKLQQTIHLSKCKTNPVNGFHKTTKEHFKAK